MSIQRIKENKQLKHTHHIDTWNYFVKISQIRYPNSVKFQQIFYDISRLLLHSIWPNFYLDGLDFQFIGTNENSVATTWVA